jgi:hypothetical protein
MIILIVSFHFFSWTVRLGSVDLSSTDDGKQKSAQQRKITRITKHPNYYDGVAYFDIALLDIEEAYFSEAVRPICLLDSKDYYPNKYDQVKTIFVFTNFGRFFFHYYGGLESF